VYSVYNSVVLYAVSYLLESGLTNIFCLESLKHGTNLYNYASIRMFGGDPAHGGKDSGSTKGQCDDDTKDKFYVFKDSDARINIQNKIFNYINSFRLIWLVKQHYLKQHIFLSGFNSVYYKLPETSNHSAEYIKKGMASLYGLINVLIVPELCFKYKSSELRVFHNDPCYSGMAYFTYEKIEPWRAAIIGTLAVGLSRDMFSRIYENPSKFLYGVAEVSAAVIIAAKYLDTAAILSSPASIVNTACAILL
jgi:hypothetical protein